MFICISFLALSDDVYAQFFDKRARYHALAVQGIGSYFYGDVSSGLNTIRSGAGVEYIYKFSPNASFVTGINYIRLLGDDDGNSSPADPATVNKYIRNLHFRNDVLEWFVQLRYDVFSSTEHYQKRPSFNIFAGVGLGIIYSNPQAKDSSGNWTNLQPLQTEGVSYSSFTGFIPLSAGLRYKISNNIDIEFELSYHITFTDYLDDVKGTYADPAALNSESARYFANRSTEPVNTFDNQSRDLNYIENTLGYAVLTSPGGYSYISGTGPRQPRGSKIGPDGYFLGMLRFVFIIPQKGISCPRYRD
ncbi:MAG: outer membrane beta-barrel protein [Cytophagales bacterium]|nr:outer membrane beta-barrel protein [Cytophaga sp.]